MKLLQIIQDSKPPITVNLGTILQYTVTRGSKRSKTAQVELHNLKGGQEPYISLKGTQEQCQALYKEILVYASQKHQERHTIYLDEKGHWIESKKDF